MNKKIDFMRRDVLEIREKFISGEIDDAYMDEIPNERFMQELKEVLEKEFKDNNWDGELHGLNEELADGTQEGDAYKFVMGRVHEKIKIFENYYPDLCTDLYMAFLRVDNEYDVLPDGLMERGWESEPYNKKIDMENVRKHYPLVDYGDGDFPMSGIPGGCGDYHRLMMQQENIGIFDIGSDTESLKKYAFPATYNIYRKLEGTPIENLILMEKTLGVGYTGQMICYLEKIANKKQLEGLKEVIKCMTEMPMFIRKILTDEIWKYLYRFKYNDASIQCVKGTVNGIVYIVCKAYKKIWRHSWQMYTEGKFPYIPLKAMLNGLWEAYFSNIKRSTAYLLESWGISIQRSGEEYFRMAKESFMIIENICQIISLESTEEIRRIYNLYDYYKEEAEYGGETIDAATILRKACDEYARQEEYKLKKIDPRRNTKNLGPMDVYA